MSIELVMPSNHLILCHPLLLLPQSFSASGSFPVSQHFVSGGQSVRASASVLPMNIHGWFPLGWSGWISLQSPQVSSVFSNTTVRKHQFFGAQPSLWSNSHIHRWWLEKTIALTIRTFVSKVMSLLFNMLSKFVIAFLSRSKCLLIPLCFLPLRWGHLHIWGYWYFSQKSWFQLVLHPAWHSAWCTLHVS